MAEQTGAGKLAGYYTFKQAVEKSGITPQVFAWLVHTEPMAFPTLGKRIVYTDETIAELLRRFRAKDPVGRFLAKQERKNGPNRRTRRKAAPAAN